MLARSNRAQFLLTVSKLKTKQWRANLALHAKETSPVQDAPIRRRSPVRTRLRPLFLPVPALPHPLRSKSIPENREIIGKTFSGYYDF